MANRKGSIRVTNVARNFERTQEEICMLTNQRRISLIYGILERFNFGTDPERFSRISPMWLNETRSFPHYNGIFDGVRCTAKMILSLNKNRFINLRSKYYPKLLGTNMRRTECIYIVQIFSSQNSDERQDRSRYLYVIL